MLVCDRHHWPIHTFLDLPEDEQMDWIAWEIQHQRDLDRTVSELVKGKPYAEQITARALLALVRNG